MTPPRRERPGTPRNARQQPFGGLLSGRALILLFVAAVLLTTFLAIGLIDITGSSDNETTALYRQTGCLEMSLRQAGDQPAVPLSQAEADAREQLGEVDSLAEIDPDTEDDFRLGDLVWAEYGELVPANADQIWSGRAWVLVFDDSREQSWWDRLIIRSVTHRFSAVYHADTQQVVTACAGRVS